MHQVFSCSCLVQRTTIESGFSSTTWILGMMTSSFGCQTWWQIPLPLKLSFWAPMYSISSILYEIHYLYFIKCMYLLVFLTSIQTPHFFKPSAHPDSPFFSFICSRQICFHMSHTYSIFFALVFISLIKFIFYELFERL